jgi:7-cyano-7-deazaguanine synthase
MEKSKNEVLKLALEIGVPLELTWSCFYTKKIPCGTCKACRERIPAFKSLKMHDPLYKNIPDFSKSHKMERSLAIDEEQTS